MSLVPADFTIIGDAELSPAGEGDGDGEVLLDEGDDAGFVAFGVHEGQSVVVLEHEDGDAEAPDVEHGAVDNEGFGFLRVVGEGFFEELLVGGALEEIAAASSKACETALGL